MQENKQEKKKKQKKPLLKLLLLPLFLGVVCLISAGALIGVNALTAPRIAQVQLERQNKGYMEILELDSLEGIDVNEEKSEELEKELTDDGIEQRVTFTKGEDVIGVVYNVTVSGFEGDVKFQVGFKEGNYAGFKLIAQGESEAKAVRFLNNINDLIKGKPADGDFPIADSEYAGASVTGDPVVKAIKRCASDYLSLGGK